MLQENRSGVEYVNDAQQTITLFGAINAVTIAILYLAARRGFDNPLDPVLKVLGISLFLLSLPSVWGLIRRDRRETPWVISGTVLSVVGLAGMLAASFLPTAITSALLYGLLAISSVFMAVLLIQWLRRAHWVQSLIFVAGAIIISLWAAAFVWGVRYTSPVFTEQIPIGFGSHIDPFYHASIASMIDTYGIASHGMGGIAYLGYHTGSHWIFALLSELVGITPLSFYQLGVPVIFFPLFFTSFLYFMAAVRRAADAERKVRLLRTDFWFWLIFFVVNTGVIARILQGYINIHWYTLISESYLVAMMFGFTMMTMLVSCWAATRLQVEHLRLWEKAIILVGVPLLVGSMGFSKISVMIVLIAAGVYLYLRLRLYRYWLFTLTLLSSFGMAAALNRILSVVSTDGAQIRPFYDLTYLETEWLPWWLSMYFLWTWLLLAAKLKVVGIRKLRDLPEAIFSGKLIDVETAVFIALVGAAPGQILAIKGGSSGYFADIQRWVSAALLTSTLPSVLTSLNWDRLRKIRLADIPVQWGFAGLALLPFIGSLLLMTPHALVQYFRDVAMVHDVYEGGDQGGSASFDHEVNLATEHLDTYALLEELSEMPKDVKRQTVLYIPYTNDAYWNMGGERHCLKSVLIAPAVTGMATLNVLPQEGCEQRLEFASAYTFSEGDTATRGSRDEADLCEEAVAKGFAQVLIIDDEGGVPAVREVRCIE